jgi:hypothetical protein
MVKWTNFVILPSEKKKKKLGCRVRVSNKLIVVGQVVVRVMMMVTRMLDDDLIERDRVPSTEGKE